jgi:hypothetical protein
MSEEFDNTPDDLEVEVSEVQEPEESDVETSDYDADDTDDDDGDVTNPEEDEADEYANLDVPEGAVEDEYFELAESLKPLFEDMGLSREEAKQLTDYEYAASEAKAKAQSESWSAQVEEWREELMADKKLGGDHWEESVGTVKMALDKLGTPDLEKIFDTTGMLQQPEVFRFLHKIGKLTKEDSPGQLGGSVEDPMDAVSIMYPNN